MYNYELLSPAGDKEKLIMAVTYGADAVYLAGRAFGMRASTANFSDEELQWAVNFCHEKNVKIYITCNTLPRENEIYDLPNYLSYLESINVDGLIIADLGVLSLAKKFAPNTSIHISTQLGVVNSYTANYLHDIGASTVVLSRELSIEEIAAIRKNVPDDLRIECFVHGAMCMSFSGRCLLSNFLTSRDANRGKCAQPCRWKYHVVEESKPGIYHEISEDKGTYLFNSNDMCMIEHINDLIKVGVNSFKIEGRMKSAYYTACITNAYRHAIDSAINNEQVDQIWIDETKKVSHRNYNTGFFYGDPGENYEDSSYSQDAEIVAIVNENNCLSLRNKFFKGDELELLTPNSMPIKFISSIDSGNIPLMTFNMDLPIEAPKYSILRKVKK